MYTDFKMPGMAERPVCYTVTHDDLIDFGEIGLSGECRGVSDCDLRIKEAIRLGFKTILLPYTNYKKLKVEQYDANIVGIKSLFEALKYI